MNFYKNAKNYLIFSAGVLISSLGIGFITRAGLGTSPISGIPFILSLVTAPSMGVYTFCFNMLFVLGEALIRRRFSFMQAMQIPAALLFSLCIDAALFIIPTQYGGAYINSIIYLAIGCIVMALGISLEIRANVIMLPGEALVRAISQRFRYPFGNVKVIFDSTLTLIAVVLAFLFFHRLNGVREGTVFSALATGQIVTFFSFLQKKIYHLKNSHQPTDPVHSS